MKEELKNPYVADDIFLPTQSPHNIEDTTQYLNNATPYINMRIPKMEETTQKESNKETKQTQHLETTKPYRRIVRTTGPNWYQVVIDIDVFSN